MTVAGSHADADTIPESAKRRIDKMVRDFIESGAEGDFVKLTDLTEVELSYLLTFIPDNQRDQRDRYVAKIEREVRRIGYVANSNRSPLMLRIHRGRVYLEDGQHRVLLLIKLLKEGFFRRTQLEVWFCLTKDKRAYAVAGGSGENKRVEADFAEYMGLERLHGSLMAGILFEQADFRSPPDMSAAERVAAAHSDKEVIEFLKRSLPSSGGGRKILSLAGIYAVAARAFKLYPDKKDIIAEFISALMKLEQGLGDRMVPQLKEAVQALRENESEVGVKGKVMAASITMYALHSYLFEEPLDKSCLRPPVVKEYDPETGRSTRRTGKWPSALPRPFPMELPAKKKVT